jgi:cytosine/adenosine deaminase-related metal-dependent hydrolase
LLQVHYGAIRDPIAALVESGSGSDIETVIVDGQTLVKDGKAVLFDEAVMMRDVQAEGERIWQALPEWHWTGKTVNDIVPPSYRVRG